MNCKNCNHTISPGATFCGNCGLSVAAQVQGSNVVNPVQNTPVLQQAPLQPQAPVAQQAAPISQPVVQSPTVVAPVPEGGSKAIAAMVLGIVSIIGTLIPIIGFILGILAVVFGSTTLKSDKKGYAITGIVLGGISILLSLFLVGYFMYTEGINGEYSSIILEFITNPSSITGAFFRLL